VALVRGQGVVGSSLSGVGSPARKGCADLFDRAAD
jgi:hypothetical protein